MWEDGEGKEREILKLKIDEGGRKGPSQKTSIHLFSQVFVENCTNSSLNLINDFALEKIRKQPNAFG